MFSKSARFVRALTQCESIHLSPTKTFSSINKNEQRHGCSFTSDHDKPKTPILQPKLHTGKNDIQWRGYSNAHEVCIFINQILYIY